MPRAGGKYESSSGEKMLAQMAGCGSASEAGDSETYCDMRSMWRREVSAAWGAIARVVGGVRWFAIGACRVARKVRKKVGDGSEVAGMRGR